MEVGRTLSYRVQSTLLKNDLAKAETQVSQYETNSDYEKSVRELQNKIAGQTKEINHLKTVLKNSVRSYKLRQQNI